jgi:hypothetical protein
MYKITACNSDCDFTILHLVTNESIHAHSSRLKYYCDSDLEVTADLKHQITHDEMRYKIQKIRDHDVKEDGIFLLIEWEGFDEEDSTWEPINIINDDVPGLVKKYVFNLKDKDKMKKNSSSCN